MGTYSSFKTDEDLETKGVELDLGDAGTFQLARAGGANTRFRKRMEVLMRPHRLAVQRGTLPEEVAQELLITAYAECVVLGWTGVSGPDGEPMEFSRENCRKLFTDLPDLFSTVQQAAMDSAVFREQVREDDAGN